MSDRVQTSTPVVIPVDSEHSGLRLVVVLVFVASGVLSFLLLSMLIPSAGLNLLALFGAFIIASGATALVERVLRQRWPSGRAVRIDSSGVTLTRKNEVEHVIRAGRDAESFLWRFQTRRRSRVPKGWHMLALALEQDESFLAIYTLLSPGQFKNLATADRFTALQVRREDDRSPTRRGRDDMLLAGEQRRLLQAENRRWTEGAEMTPDDFNLFVDHLIRMFPEWLR